MIEWDDGTYPSAYVCARVRVINTHTRGGDDKLSFSVRVQSINGRPLPRWGAASDWRSTRRGDPCKINEPHHRACSFASLSVFFASARYKIIVPTTLTYIVGVADTGQRIVRRCENWRAATVASSRSYLVTPRRLAVRDPPPSASHQSFHYDITSAVSSVADFLRISRVTLIVVYILQRVLLVFLPSPNIMNDPAAMVPYLPSPFGTTAEIKYARSRIWANVPFRYYVYRIPKGTAFRFFFFFWYPTLFRVTLYLIYFLWIHFWAKKNFRLNAKKWRNFELCLLFNRYRFRYTTN